MRSTAVIEGVVARPAQEKKPWLEEIDYGDAIGCQFYIWNIPPQDQRGEGVDGRITAAVRVVCTGPFADAVNESDLAPNDHVQVTGRLYHKIIRTWPPKRPGGRVRRRREPVRTYYLEVNGQGEEGIERKGTIDTEDYGLVLFDDERSDGD